MATKINNFEQSEDIASNKNLNNTLGDVIERRYSRRDFLKGSLAVTAIAATFNPLAEAVAKALPKTSFPFFEIKHGVDETHHVAEGYDADVLLRWGDPIFADAPEFDPYKQSADAQEKQFGYNNDYVGFFPLPLGSNNADHGLLAVNHEYTNEELMFPNIGRQDKKDFPDMTTELVDIEMAAHGMSVVEVKRIDGKWQVVRDGKYNRRISPRSTKMAIAGPAAGHERMKTSTDKEGREVVGMINNCAGGMTPWGTVLTAEENFNGYFWGDREKHAEKELLERYGAPGQWYAWGKFHDRFDINKEPNEINRFGWIVEIDPYDPESTPIKRTALGRFKHEGANSIVNKDGRIVVYSGDDQRFDYLYKFVSKNKYNPDDRQANMKLLDEGTLYVAKFNNDGKVNWLPLVYGEGKLTKENGFNDQGDVLISTRKAADLLGATPMDRPEDVEPNPKTNKVYVMLTNNSKRKDDQIDAANPRASNTFGHIVELTPPAGDHTATETAWDILVKCGDPSKGEVGAMWNPATTENGWFAAPDNCAVDSQGRLWVTTDQGKNWAKSGTADGVWAMETEGELRGTGKMFFRVPVGAEMCGPVFTPNDETLFVAVQHPASDGTKAYEPFGKNSTFDDPATRWPDFDKKTPPRPSVVAITKKGGGVIGS